MAVVTRYFSTAAAGAGDGTSWANRAQFVNAGTYSSVITGFSFAGSDSLHCYLGPGTYAITANLSITPTSSNPFILQACDSSGNPLAHPDPDWMSCQPDFDTSGMPLIQWSTNIAFLTSTQAHSAVIGINFEASSLVNQAMIASIRKIERCRLANSTSQSAAACVSVTSGTVIDSILTCSGTGFGSIFTSSAEGVIQNCRISGNSSATVGNRECIRVSGQSNPHITRCTLRNAVQGIRYSSTSSATVHYITNNVIYNCTSGIVLNQSTMANAGTIDRNFIIGGTDGIAADFPQCAVLNRLRGQSSTTFAAAMANWPNTALNLLDSGSDADEFVDATNGDYRIKSGSTYHSRLLGAGDEITAGSSASYDPFNSGLVA